MTETYPMIAKTFSGLEDVLEQELIDLGMADVQPGRRMVSFSGGLKEMYLANLRLRTATRILKPIYQFEAEDTELFYVALKQFAWDSVMDVDSTFSVDVVSYSSIFTHSRFLTYKTKDAIVDWFVEHTPEGKRPNVKLSNPMLRVHVHVAETHVTVALDSSGESLHKRGYRYAQDTAPINEVLAAGILLKMGWKGQCDLIDPFCGSGTFLIEGALIAKNIAPGLYRESFAFEKWKDFDAELYSRLYDDDSYERPMEHHIYGSDISPKALAIAQTNVKRAGLQRDITLSVKDFAETTPVELPAMLVMNPPYGERLSDYNLEKLYSMIGTTLKHRYAGASAAVIAYEPEHFAAIGLRPDKKEKLFNGALECELRQYTLFEGSNKEYKTEQNRSGSQREQQPEDETTARRHFSNNRSRTPRRDSYKEKKFGERNKFSRHRSDRSGDNRQQSFGKPDTDQLASRDSRRQFSHRRAERNQNMEDNYRERRPKRKSRLQVFESDSTPD